MRNLIYIILVIVVVTSCKESPEAKFEKDGVSLICPKGWKITDEENLDDRGYYLSIEKDGFTSSGLLCITWINGEIGLEGWMNDYQNELKSNIIYRNSKLVFGEKYEDQFNNITCLSTKFTASIVGVKHEGVLSVFYDKDKTFGILKQEAVEDKAENKQGFEAIENSFIIE